MLRLYDYVSELRLLLQFGDAVPLLRSVTLHPALRQAHSGMQ
jgi:hypothetical protein